MSPDELARRLAVLVITDAEIAGGRALLDVVRAALAGGAPAVQLRDKLGSARALTELAVALQRETARAGALLFVNDRLDVALAAGADGAHLGQDDVPVAAARRVVPPGFLLGVSVETVAQATRAEADGADYLGAGPVYFTASKPDASAPTGLPALAEIARATRLPVVAIGGIDETNAAEVAAAGAAGVAVIRAVMAAPDAAAATRALLGAVRRGAGRR